jgi:MoxR-like ATPase
MNDDLSRLLEIVEKIRVQVGKVIIGQEDVIDKALVTVLAGGHALVEGVPGVGKTLLVRALARTLGGGFSRIQFTPDLMPADITGTNIFNMKSNEFVLSPGPVFCTFLLADEINRAPAKTQSALLQAMQEKTVTIDRKTYRLPAGFTVFATQNPVEFEGTYPLPEAQMDRFLLRITMQELEREQELSLVRRTLGNDAPEELLAGNGVECVVTADEALRCREILRSLTVRDEIAGYLLDVVRSTRTHHAVQLGAGPRSAQALALAVRACAAVSGRDFATPDDVRRMAVPVLEHRILVQPDFEIEGVTAAEVIESILQEIPVPR